MNHSSPIKDEAYAMKMARRGLPVALGFSISDAVSLLDIGRVEDARLILERALMYASGIDREVKEHVGTGAVREWVRP